MSFLYHLNEIFIPKLDDCTALAHEEDEFGFTIFGTSLVVMQFETVGTISWVSWFESFLGWVISCWAAFSSMLLLSSLRLKDAEVALADEDEISL